MKRNSSSRRTAVVIGASVAGLSTAAVLSRRFEEVVLVDRDSLGDQPSDRRGVPQGRHAHGLLPAGHQRMESWLPGFTEDLLANGAREVDLGDEVLWYQGDGARLKFNSGVRGPVASRALLEHHMRRRVLDLPNVSLRSGVGVTGLTATPDRRTVTGVTLDDGTTLAADLVVDASGRSGRSVPWLVALGYEEPSVSAVTINMGYASRVYRRNPADTHDFEAYLIMAPPPGGRQGVLFPLEGDRWMVTLAGFHGDQPPRDAQAFLEFARTLPDQVVADVIETCEPLTDIVCHRLPSNQRRHVERLRSVPGGLVMLGDAVCSFNPVYGQGMSTATLQAEALGKVLDATSTLDERFVRKFYRKVAKAVTPAWQMSTGADFALPDTTGPKAPGTDMINRYMGKVLRASQVDEVVCRRLLEVTCLLRPPRDMMTPAMIARVRRINHQMGPRVVAETPVEVPELAEAA